jgi:hypothetical protein
MFIPSKENSGFKARDAFVNKGDHSTLLSHIINVSKKGSGVNVTEFPSHSAKQPCIQPLFRVQMSSQLQPPTMPTKSYPIKPKFYRARDILLAIQAIKNKETSSIREVARRFNVPRSTLADRINGHQNRSEKRANDYELTRICRGFA